MKRNLFGASLITMSCLYGMLAIILILVCFLLEVPISFGLLLSMIILIIQFLVSPAINDFIFRVFYKVKWNAELPDYLRLFIEESCKKHNMKYPKIGFIDDGSPNAFTYGRTKNDARVVITRGILDLLNEDEAKSVVAHELGHANHYDMLFMTAAQLVPLVLYYVYEMFLGNNRNRRSRSSRNGNNNSGSYADMIGLIAYVLYIISQYIILWLSRTREYYADSFAVEETKNPSALASALVKIGFGLSMGSSKEDSAISKNNNTLGISNAKVSKGIAIGAYNNGGVSKENIIKAMRWERWNVWAKWLELNSTHPLISKRLLAISERCPEFNQEPYIVFNEQKPESYVDDFLIELGLVCLPMIIFTSAIIATAITENISILGIGGILFTSSLFLLLNRTHKNKDYRETNVAKLLSEVKVSNITSIPAIVEGKIIGRGNPGCIFNEDFVIQDNTGIIFLDYNQPLRTLEKLFAIFKSKEYFDKNVRVTGWYRRGMVPYIEVYSMEVDGVTKYCHTYKALKIFYWILMALSVWGLIASLV